MEETKRRGRPTKAPEERIDRNKYVECPDCGKIYQHRYKSVHKKTDIHKIAIALTKKWTKQVRKLEMENQTLRDLLNE